MHLFQCNSRNDNKNIIFPTSVPITLSCPSGNNSKGIKVSIEVITPKNKLKANDIPIEAILNPHSMFPIPQQKLKPNMAKKIQNGMAS